jgi:hypothetical protein
MQKFTLLAVLAAFSFSIGGYFVKLPTGSRGSGQHSWCLRVLGLEPPSRHSPCATSRWESPMSLFWGWKRSPLFC